MENKIESGTLEELINLWLDNYKNKKFVSEKIARNLLGISQETVRDLIKRKKINYICLAGKIYIPFDMEYFIKNNLPINLDELEKSLPENDSTEYPWVK